MVLNIKCQTFLLNTCRWFLWAEQHNNPTLLFYWRSKLVSEPRNTISELLSSSIAASINYGIRVSIAQRGFEQSLLQLWQHYFILLFPYYYMLCLSYSTSMGSDSLNLFNKAAQLGKSVRQKAEDMVRRRETAVLLVNLPT